MAVAEHVDLESEEGLAAAFFALHGPIASNQATDVGDALDAARELVLDVIGQRSAAQASAARDELRQLIRAADGARGLAEESRGVIAEWDRQLTLSLQAATARDARQRSAQERGVLTQRIIELLADTEMRPAVIATELGVTRAHVSRALRQLRNDGIVEATQHPGHDGRGLWYRATQTRLAA